MSLARINEFKVKQELGVASLTVTKRMSESRKWKPGLLKTGLPLEYVTANELIKRGHEILGAYPYSRPDEAGDIREFSIDIRTHKSLEVEGRRHTFSMLVECKYRQPGVSWVFSPLPNSFYPIGIVQSTEDFIPARLHSHALWEFEGSVGYCVSGIELTNTGGNRSGPNHGISQLRYAMPPFMKHEYNLVYDHVWDEGSQIDLFCTLLVTTAELRVVRQGLSLKDFENADELDALTELRDSVIMNESPGPQLEEYANRLAAQFVEGHPGLEKRLDALDQVLVGPEYETRYAPDVDSIRRSFSNGTERVLIVNFNSFQSVMDRLDEAIHEHLASHKSYGKLVDGEHGTILESLKGETIASIE